MTHLVPVMSLSEKDQMSRFVVKRLEGKILFLRDDLITLCLIMSDFSPTPTVKWKRDDNSKIAINKSLSGK